MAIENALRVAAECDIDADKVDMGFLKKLWDGQIRSLHCLWCALALIV
jgi:hypothetical protein